MTEPKHGDRGECRTCGGDIEYVVYDQSTGLGTVEVLDAWWAHLYHPQDGHDAEPRLPCKGRLCVSREDCLNGCFDV